MKPSRAETRLRAGIVLALLALISSACGGQNNRSDSETANRVTIAVSSFSIANGLTLLADRGGFFKKEGLDVRLVDAQTGSQALTTVLSGDADFATTSTNTVLASTAQGKKVQAVLRLYGGVSSSLVLSQKVVDQLTIGMSASVGERLKALKGLTIASVSPDSAFTTTLEAAAATVDTPIKFAYMEQPAMLAALSRGAIDGFVASSPLSNSAELKGDGVTWLDGPGGDYPDTGGSTYFFVSLAATADWISSHKDLAKRITRAYESAARQAQADPEASGRTVQGAFPDLDPKLYELMWEQNRPAFVTPVPKPGDIALIQAQFKGDGEVEVKKLDPSSILSPEIVGAPSD